VVVPRFVGNRCPAVQLYSPPKVSPAGSYAHQALALVPPDPPTYQLPPDVNTRTESVALSNLPWIRVRKHTRPVVEPRGEAGAGAV
jgi:hypothetical protein